MWRFFQYIKLALAGRTTAPHTRTFTFTRTWMRLYRFKDFYIDVLYSGNRYGAVIQGEYQPTAPAGARVNLFLLHDTDDTMLEDRVLTKPGPFRFVVHKQGEYQLIAQIDDWVKEVTRINVS